MRSHSESFAASALSLGIFSVLVICSAPGGAESLLECPKLELFHEHGGPEVPTNEMMPRLEALEVAKAGVWSRKELAACYKELADDYRDRGSYRAEKLYLRAVELSQQSLGHPQILEAIARYYRTFRGSKGLFAESEDYYLRAERAIDDAIAVARAGGTTPHPTFSRLREEIIRGRIELNKREGLGILIPSQPGRRFGVYLGSQVEYGEFPLSQNDLLAEYRRARDNGLIFESRDMLREPSGLGQHHRLRVRFGKYPYLDFGWHDVDRRNAIADDWNPGKFNEFDIDEIEVGVEDTLGIAPVADLLWRLEYRRGESDVEQSRQQEDFYRFTGLTTLTRNFGRLQANLDLAGSYASITPKGSSGEDDWIAAAALRMLHFPEFATTERRIIDPRGYEYALGFVQHRHKYAGGVDLIQDTFFAGIKLAEVLRDTDVQFLSNVFRNTVEGESNRDSSDLELNLILTHRILDFVNNMEFRQADRPIGIAQWAFNVRLFEDISTESFDDFESRGAVLSSFVELFSGPANRSSIILEASYEIRRYYHLDDTQHMFRTSLRLGF